MGRWQTWDYSHASHWEAVAGAHRQRGSGRQIAKGKVAEAHIGVCIGFLGHRQDLVLGGEAHIGVRIGLLGGRQDQALGGEVHSGGWQVPDTLPERPRG